MNYIVLNDNEYYNDIQLSRFKEVSIDGRNRVDGIFGTITNEILEESSTDRREGDSIFREQWLCGDCGVRFVALKVPQDILYQDSGESLEKCFGLFNPEKFWLEMGSIRIKNQRNRYEYFIIAYNKNSFNFKIIFDKKYIEKEKEEILKYVCKKIEDKIL